MRAALYYPHTELRQQNLLKKCLLLWDRLELIVPYEGYNFHYENRLMAEAIELIGYKYCPSNKEKKQAHDAIEDFATNSLPESFYYGEKTSSSMYRYGMWPQKLLPETWDMLLELQLVGKKSANSDYPLEDAAGLALMSILADCCAGTTRARITDRGAAYASLTNLLTKESKPSGREFEKIVPISLSAIRTSDISLERLIAFRKREEKERGFSLRNLRHNYLDKISSHVNKISELNNENDYKELNRQFELEMKDDLKSLQSELRMGKVEALLSKEILVTIVAAAGSFFALKHGAPVSIPEVFSFAGAPVAAGGIAAVGSKYVSSRINIMKKHPMAYLYEIQNQNH